MKQKKVISPKIDLTALDYKILFELDQDARVSLSQLAKRLRIGRDQLDYRFQRLINLGVIKQFSAAINPMRLGLEVYKVYLRFGGEYRDPQIIIDDLSKQNSIYWIAHCAGNWDLMFSISARSPRDFFSQYRKILSQHGHGIIASEVCTLVEVHLFKRSYLTNSANQQGIIYGGELGNEHLSSIDFEIISALIADARITNAELARQLNNTPATIDYHLKKLEDLKIIVGYRCNLDLEKISRQTYKAQIFYAQFDAEDEERLFEFCKKHPEVTFFSKQIGSWQIEIEIEACSYSEYMEFMTVLRSKFPKLIRTISTNMLKFTTVNWRPEMMKVHN
jgi:DNA-binding Lrp family transcriptional regulator